VSVNEAVAVVVAVVVPIVLLEVDVVAEKKQY
jgi:hypothetical protein